MNNISTHGDYEKNSTYCSICEKKIRNPKPRQVVHPQCKYARQYQLFRINYKPQFLSLKINGCSICGYDACPTALCFHHVIGENKKFPLTLANYDSKSSEEFINEMQKCILFCANCHRELHYFENQKEEN